MLRNGVLSEEEKSPKKLKEIKTNKSKAFAGTWSHIDDKCVSKASRCHLPEQYSQLSRRVYVCDVIKVTHFSIRIEQCSRLEKSKEIQGAP